MKKNVLYLAAGLLALASCSQDETTGTDNGGSIRFRPAVGNVTRGPVITTDNITTFKVSSYVTGAAANFFTDLQVNKTGSSWNTAQVYYWPGTGTLNFFAYAPVDVTTVTVSPTARAINNFSPAAKVAEQKDVVVAFATGTKAANENSGVPLTFKHALSQIEVKAKSANTTAYEIKVLETGTYILHRQFHFPHHRGNRNIACQPLDGTRHGEGLRNKPRCGSDAYVRSTKHHQEQLPHDSPAADTVDKRNQRGRGLHRRAVQDLQQERNQPDANIPWGCRQVRICGRANQYQLAAGKEIHLHAEFPREQRGGKHRPESDGSDRSGKPEQPECGPESGPGRRPGIGWPHQVYRYG